MTFIRSMRCSAYVAQGRSMMTLADHIDTVLADVARRSPPFSAD